MIEVRNYDKAELAMLYFPKATEKAAVARLSRWIKRIPALFCRHLWSPAVQAPPLLHPPPGRTHLRIPGRAVEAAMHPEPSFCPMRPEASFRPFRAYDAILQYP